MTADFAGEGLDNARNARLDEWNVDYLRNSMHPLKCLCDCGNGITIAHKRVHEPFNGRNMSMALEAAGGARPSPTSSTAASTSPSTSLSPCPSPRPMARFRSSEFEGQARRGPVGVAMRWRWVVTWSGVIAAVTRRHPGHLSRCRDTVRCDCCRTFQIWAFGK